MHMQVAPHKAERQAKGTDKSCMTSRSALLMPPLTGCCMKRHSQRVRMIRDASSLLVSMSVVAQVLPARTRCWGLGFKLGYGCRV
jgi:hypothetical protein